MKVYLASISTSLQEIDTKVYETFEKSLKYIYDSLKSLVSEEFEDCDFFDRDYIQKYFTEYFLWINFVELIVGHHMENLLLKSIEKVKDDKYQFVFSPVNLVQLVQNALITSLCVNYKY
jgi:hypothetical protein